MVLPLPPGLESLTRNLTQHIPARFRPELREDGLHLPPGLRTNLHEAWFKLRQQAGPVAAQVAVMLRQAAKKAGQTEDTTLGSTFAALCVVGLNKAELLLPGEKQGVISDNWQELVDASLRRRANALVFFAPRDLQGQPADPYLFLMGEGVTSADSAAEAPDVATNRQLAVTNMGAMALLDYCRIGPAAPNTVNLLVAADCIFHWDVKDNYVLPTTPTTWVRDVEAILRNYPRTTRANLFTNWESDLLNPSPRLTLHLLRNLPLDSSTWLNKPTVQERYGPKVLGLGLVVATLVASGLWLQGRGLAQLEEELAVAQQQVPRGGQFSEMERAVAEQEKWLASRPLIALAARDTARAIQNSGFKVANFEIKNPEPTTPPKQVLVTIEASGQDYPGWLQQEPIARNFLMQSALLQGVRKTPSAAGTASGAANSFRLEAIMEVAPLLREYRTLVKPQTAAAAVQATPTTSPQAPVEAQP